MAGENDPISGGDRAMLRAGQFLEDMGFSSVEEKMYRELRHEIFMDDGRQTPFADAARFCLTHLPARAPSPAAPGPAEGGDSGRGTAEGEEFL